VACQCARLCWTPWARHRMCWSCFEVACSWAKEFRARGLVGVARRRLPALLRLGWGLGGRRRGRALVARTDFSPLDIAH
jgi:hypothetical protein